MFIPVHMIVREAVMSSDDCYGLRYSCVVPKDIHGFKFFEDIAKSKATPANHLSKAIMAVTEKAK